MVTIVIILALAGCLLVSLFVSRGLRLTEYSSNRQRSGFSEVLFTILGSLVGGWMFFGLCAIGYQAGIVGYFIGLGYALGLGVLALAIPRIKRAMTEHDCDTLDDLLGSYLGWPVQLAVTSVNLLFFLAVLAAQFIAMAAFLKVFASMDGPLAFYTAVFVVVAYTAIAGFKGVVITDVWQFYILAASALAIFVLLTIHTDLTAIRALESSYFNGTGYGVAFLVGVLVFFPPSILARTDLWQRIASAQDARTAKRAFLTSIPILLLFYVILTTIGIYGRAALGPQVEPETSGFRYFLSIVQADPSAPLSLGSAIFLSLLALGVFAALLSTADTNLNIVAVSITKIIRRTAWTRFERETDDKVRGIRTPLETGLLTTARVVTVGLGILALAVAHVIPDMVDLIVGAASAVMVFLPTVLSSLLSKRRNPPAAVASIAFGILILIAMLFFVPKLAFLPATIASFLVYFVVARFVPSLKPVIRRSDG